MNDQHNDQHWGLCKNCRWWQIEPSSSVENPTMGVCIEESLQPFQLRVSGNSGCNCFMEGEPARAAGASAIPPIVEPAR